LQSFNFVFSEDGASTLKQIRILCHVRRYFVLYAYVGY